MYVRRQPYLLNMFGMGAAPEQGNIQYFGTAYTGTAEIPSVGTATVSAPISVMSPPFVAPSSTPATTAPPAPPASSPQIPRVVLLGGAALALYLLFKKG